MTKDETKRRLNCLEADCKNLGTEISILKDQFAEAEKLEELDKLLEKPKLRHGDFGLSRKTHPRLVIEGWRGNLTTCGDASIREDQSNLGDPPDIILGNVFDLLKEWSEPMESRQEVACIDIKIKGTELFIGDYLFASLESKEKLWHILGHAIAELKRKENKCS